MSRYVMEMVVQGDADTKLHGVETGLSKVTEQANRLNEAFDKNDKESDKLGEIASSSKAGALLELADKLDAKADAFMDFAAGMVEGGKALFDGIIQDASTFQDTESALQYAFGDGWQRVFKQVKDEAANLTFTFDEVAGLAASMGRMKINPFGTTGDDLAVFKSKTGEAISALQVLQDVSDATGRDTQHLMFSIRNAMAGQFKSLKDAVDMPADAFKELQKEINKAKEPQEKYNILIKELGEYFGGAGLAKAHNWSKAVMQFPDLLQQLKAGIGMEGLEALTPVMFELVDALSGLVKDKDAVHALADAFTMVANAVGSVVHVGITMIGWLREILKAAPWLPKVAVFFLGIAAAASFAVGVLLAVASVMATIAGTVALIGVESLISGAMMAATFLPVLIAAGAALGIIALLAYAVAQTLAKGIGGEGMTGLEKVQLVFEALGQLLDSYDGKTAKLSDDMAAGLKEAGLMEFVTELFKVYHRLRTFITGFMDTMSEMSDKLGPDIIPMLNNLKKVFFELLDAFGISSAKSRAAGSDTQAWADSGKELANALIDVVRWLVKLINYSADLVHTANEWGLLKVALVAVLAVVVAIGVAATYSFVSMAVAALAPLAPLLAIGAAIAAIVVAFDQANKLAKEWDENSSGQIWRKLKQDLGFTSAEEANREAGTKTGADYDAWVAENERKKRMTPQEQQRGVDDDAYLRNRGSGQGAGGSSAAAAAAAAAGPRDDSGVKTVASVDKMSGQLAAIQTLLAAQEFNVFLDSDKIASSLKAKGVAGGGVV